MSDSETKIYEIDNISISEAAKDQMTQLMTFNDAKTLVKGTRSDYKSVMFEIK